MGTQLSPRPLCLQVAPASGDAHPSLIPFPYLPDITCPADVESAAWRPPGMPLDPHLYPCPQRPLARALNPLMTASHLQYLAHDPLPPGKVPASVNRAFVWVFPLALGLIFHRVGAAPRLRASGSPTLSVS